MASTGSGSKAGQVRTGRPARWRSPAAALAAGAVIVWILVPPPGLAGRPRPASSLAYVAGQYPTSQWLGPYLPDVIGALVCFGALLLLLKYWKPRETLGYGGVPVSTDAVLAGAVAGG